MRATMTCTLQEKGSKDEVHVCDFDHKLLCGGLGKAKKVLMSAQRVSVVLDACDAALR
jgi:hypothetical protein